MLATDSLWPTSQADLFKRNYFAPGTLRLPNSPLVRKYLEMSNDAHMLETLAGGGAVTRDAITNVFATAVGAGVFVSNGTQLRDARAHAHAHVAAPAERAAVATATKEQECGSSSHAQMQGSREVLLKQLIELSDQLAQVRIYVCPRPDCRWLVARPENRRCAAQSVTRFWLHLCRAGPIPKPLSCDCLARKQRKTGKSIACRIHSTTPSVNQITRSAGLSRSTITLQCKTNVAPEKMLLRSWPIWKGSLRRHR